jgi:hypothetical protein
MKRDDIYALLTEAINVSNTQVWMLSQEQLEQFAALVAKAERDRMIAEGWRQCAEGQHTTQYCGLLEAAVKAEREAWMKMDEVDYRDHAIRARGNATALPKEED